MPALCLTRPSRFVPVGTRGRRASRSDIPSSFHSSASRPCLEVVVEVVLQDVVGAARHGRDPASDARLRQRRRVRVLSAGAATVFDVAGTDPEELLAALDPEQREVATALRGPVAVIAGAGTGKTRAITHRIAYGVATGVYKPDLGAGGHLHHPRGGRAARPAAAARRPRRAGADLPLRRTAPGAVLLAHGRTAASCPSVLDNRMSLVAEAAGRLRVRVDTARLRDLVSRDRLGQGQQRPRPRTTRGWPSSTTAASPRIDPETVARIFTGVRGGQARPRPDRLRGHPALRRRADLGARRGRRRRSAAPTGTWSSTSTRTSARCRRRCSTLWRGDRQEICVVGDPAQTIHSFAGAQAGFLTGFARRLPGATSSGWSGTTARPRRSSGCANAVMAGRPAACLRRSRSSGAAAGRAGRSSFAEAPDEAAEAAGIADWLARPGRGRGRATARWPCCSGSTPSRRPWSRRSPSAASRTWSAAASGSTSGPRCARRC